MDLHYKTTELEDTVIQIMNAGSNPDPATRPTDQEFMSSFILELFRKAVGEYRTAQLALIEQQVKQQLESPAFLVKVKELLDEQKL